MKLILKLSTGTYAQPCSQINFLFDCWCLEMGNHQISKSKTKMSGKGALYWSHRLQSEFFDQIWPCNCLIFSWNANVPVLWQLQAQKMAEKFKLLAVKLVRCTFSRHICLDFELWRLPISKPVDLGKSYIPQKKAM